MAEEVIEVNYYYVKVKVEEPKQENEPIVIGDDSNNTQQNSKTDIETKKVTEKENKANKVLPYTGINYALLCTVAGLTIFLGLKMIYLKRLMKETDIKQEKLSINAENLNLIFPNVVENRTRNELKWKEKESRIKLTSFLKWIIVIVQLLIMVLVIALLFLLCTG